MIHRFFATSGFPFTTRHRAPLRQGITIAVLGAALVFLVCGLQGRAAVPQEPLGTGAQVVHGGHQDHSRMAGRTDSEEKVGSLTIPDVLLLDQDGREVHFYSDLVRGKTVVINSIFTTCTTICPPMGANFARLQKMLGDHVGRDVELISVSVDPVVDTPQRLKAWSAKFGAGPGWTLLTGSKNTVDGLLKSLKFFTPDKTDHSPTVLVGNPEGEWTRTHGLAPPAKLAEVVRAMLREEGSK